MSADLESQRLLGAWQAGDEAAAEALFVRYADRLIRLARHRLSAQMQQRLDAEDVVQSVYRSFFARAKEGQFSTERSGDLWRLLSAITVTKVLKKVEYHSYQRRDFRRQQPLAKTLVSVADPAFFAREPSNEEAFTVLDELQHIMASLDDRRREVLERRLRGENVSSIGDALGCSERTVRRYLESLRDLMESRLLESETDTPS